MSSKRSKFYNECPNAKYGATQRGNKRHRDKLLQEEDDDYQPPSKTSRRSNRDPHQDEESSEEEEMEEEEAPSSRGKRRRRHVVRPLGQFVANENDQHHHISRMTTVQMCLPSPALSGRVQTLEPVTMSRRRWRRNIGLRMKS